MILTPVWPLLVEHWRDLTRDLDGWFLQALAGTSVMFTIVFILALWVIVAWLVKVRQSIARRQQQKEENL